MMILRCGIQLFVAFFISCISSLNSYAFSTEEALSFFKTNSIFNLSKNFTNSEIQPFNNQNTSINQQRALDLKQTNTSIQEHENAVEHLNVENKNTSLPEHQINLSKPSEHLSNYLVLFLLNLIFTTIIVVYLAPIYSFISAKLFNAFGLKLFLLFCFSLYNLLCWIISGLNFLLLFLIYFMFFKVIIYINKRWDIFLTLKKIIPHQSKIKWLLWLCLPYVFLIFCILFSNQDWMPLWMFLIFCPLLVIFTLIFLVHNLIPYQHLYAKPYQNLLKLSLPNTSITISNSSKPNTQNDTNQAPSSKDSSGGSSGGGGASGSW